MMTKDIDITEILQKQGIIAVIRGDVTPDNFNEKLLSEKINNLPVIEILNDKAIDFNQFKRDSLTLYKDIAKQAISEKAAFYRAKFIGTDNAVKIASYMRKAAYAANALTGDAGAVAYLTPEAEARGITAQELASNILSRSASTDKIDAAINGFEVRASGAIANLTSLDEIEATLKDLQQTAENHFNNLTKGGL